MGRPTKQAQLLRDARTKLGMTNDQLAAALGKSTSGLTAWMAPATAKRYRNMPETARKLLAAILAHHPGK